MNNNIYDLSLRVVYYARVSTDSELQTSSIINQTNFFKDYINNNKNWILIGGYVDEGISGKNICNRINFKKMIKDGIDGKYDLILTKSVSRFARNTIDSIRYTDLLRKHGIGIYFINDNINTFNGDSEFRLTLMASIAQDEIRKLSDSVKFGLQQSVNRGIVLGNNNILGYRKDRGKLVVDEKEAIIVKDIFNIFLKNNYSYSNIARIINRKYNRRMDSSSIKRVLTNYKYKGYYCGKKSRVVDYKSGKRINYGVKDWLIYKDSYRVPVIIDEKVWDKVNKRIIKKNKARCVSKYNIYCFNHKRRFKYVLKRYKSNIYKYYLCCGCLCVSEELIDRMVKDKKIRTIIVNSCDDFFYVRIIYSIC